MIVVMKNSVATFIIRFDLAEAVRLKTEDLTLDMEIKIP